MTRVATLARVRLIVIGVLETLDETTGVCDHCNRETSRNWQEDKAAALLHEAVASIEQATSLLQRKKAKAS